MAQSLFSQFESSQNVDNTWVPGIFSEDEPSDEVADLLKQRREVFQRFCEATFHLPLVASEGFKRLLAKTEQEGGDTTPFVKIARDILLNDQKAGASSPQMQMMQMQMQMMAAAQNGEVRDYSPAQFLVRHAWKAKNPAAIREQLLPKLREAGKKQMADSIESYADLYFTEPEKFTDQAEAYMKAQKQQMGAMMNWQGETLGMATVVEVWRDRDLDADLTPMVMKDVKQTIKAGGWGAPSYLSDYVMAVHEIKGIKGTGQLLDKLAEAYIGPADKQKEIIKTNYDEHRVQGGTLNAHIHAYVQILQECGQEPPLMFLIYDRNKKLGLNTDNMDWQMRDMAESLGGEKTDKLIKDVQGMPFSADAEGFRDYFIEQCARLCAKHAYRIYAQDGPSCGIPGES